MHPVEQRIGVRGYHSTASCCRTERVLSAEEMNVLAPESRNLASPGHYLLLILNGNGVPPGGKFIRLR